MSAAPSPSKRLRASIGLVALSALGGCTTFGGNVKGSFSCAAPDGICAPSSSIDDRALAMIAGDSGAATTAPAGPYIEARPKAKMSRTAAAGQGLPIGQADPRRTQERVLRIVFQPYIDEQGRLHEASAVHAVVQTGEWQQQLLASATEIPDRNARAAAAAPRSLAEAVDRADPANVQVAVIDPNLPDPAAVAAARSRAADPVASIKSEVAARLAPRAGRTSPSQRQSAATGQRVSGTVSAGFSSAVTGAGRAQAPAAAVVVAPTSKIASGSDAAARVKASPDYQARAGAAEEGGRAAAAGEARLEPKPALKGTVRAAGFPSAVPEDN